MHLLVLTEDFYPDTSGGAHLRWRFCQLAAEKGHDITVFTSHEHGLARTEVVDGVEIRRPFRVKPAGLSVYSPIALITRIGASVLLFGYLCWWLRNRDVDGLYSATHLTHWVAKALSLFYNLPLVSFIGYTPSTEPDTPFTPKLLLERINFRLCMGETVFCQTPRVKRVIESVSDKEVAVLHGILNSTNVAAAASDTDYNRVQANLEIEDSNTLLVYVGRLSPLKNPTGAVEVLSQLPDEYTLAVVGEGSEQKAVERAVREQGVEERVRICGAFPHEEALETIAAADALILPSHIESYPTVVFEALALNTAVFATPVGIIPRIEHSLLHIGSVDEFPQLITRTEIDSSSGLDTETLERFSMERYTDELLDAFEDQTANETTIGGM